MIWCVEDDASIRDIEVYALTSTGFEARGFADGDTFWNALQRETPPELIVLDVMLPREDRPARAGAAAPAARERALCRAPRRDGDRQGHGVR